MVRDLRVDLDPVTGALGTQPHRLEQPLARRAGLAAHRHRVEALPPPNVEAARDRVDLQPVALPDLQHGVARVEVVAVPGRGARRGTDPGQAEQHPGRRAHGRTLLKAELSRTRAELASAVKASRCVPVQARGFRCLISPAPGVRERSIWGPVAKMLQSCALQRARRAVLRWRERPLQSASLSADAEDDRQETSAWLMMSKRSS